MSPSNNVKEMRTKGEIGTSSSVKIASTLTSNFLHLKCNNQKMWRGRYPCRGMLSEKVSSQDRIKHTTLTSRTSVTNNAKKGTFINITSLNPQTDPMLWKRRNKSLIDSMRLIYITSLKQHNDPMLWKRRNKSLIEWLSYTGRIYQLSSISMANRWMIDRT